MKRTANGVIGVDRNGQTFAIYYEQVENIEKTRYGCAIRLGTGELIPISCMGYDIAKDFFRR